MFWRNYVLSFSFSLVLPSLRTYWIEAYNIEFGVGYRIGVTP
jgi:hypothetical protein